MLRLCTMYDAHGNNNKIKLTNIHCGQSEQAMECSIIVDVTSVVVDPRLSPDPASPCVVAK